MDNDHELLIRYIDSADQTAFTALVRRHVHMVHAAARRQCHEEADDITQAVFLLLAQKAPKLRGQASLAGWLHRTTGHCCANVRRIIGRRRRHERQAAMQTQTTTSGRQARSDAPDRLLSLLDEALRRLPGKYREAVLLRYLQGQTAEQTGSLLGISTDAAGKRATRGLEKLRRYFAQRGVTVPAATLSATLAAESAARASEGLIASASVVSAGSASAPAASIAAAASEPTASTSTSALVLLAVACVAVVSAVAVMLLATGRSSPPAPAPPADRAAQIAPAPAVASPEAEAALPGRIVVTHFDLIIDAGPAQRIAAATAPIDADTEFFTAHSGVAADVFGVLREAYAARQVHLGDRQMTHRIMHERDFQHPIFMSQLWGDFAVGSLRFTTGLNWSGGPITAIHETPDGVELRISDPRADIFLQEYSTEPREIRRQPAPVEFTANLEPGEVIVLLGDFGPIRGEHFFSVTVWQAYKATEDQHQHIVHVRDAANWVAQGPGGLREWADRSDAWSGGREIDLDDVPEQWTRRLPNGVTVRLLGISRPSRWHFHWWDPDGVAVAPTWRLESPWMPHGVTLQSSKAVAVSITWPENEPHHDPGALRLMERGYAYAVPHKRRAEFWVSAGEFSEQPITPGQRIELGEGVVHFERIIPYEENVFAMVREDVSPHFEIWVDAVTRDGKRIRVSPGHVRHLHVGTPGERWRQFSENLRVTPDDIDHYVLRWRPRHQALFTDYAVTPATDPPAPPESQHAR